ncbi:uncharacterized protein [Euwallacea similis]|uniref:uncharacterized protein n=1 Tax=Euwallacea similis TaxID=1736056 RepID=UPI00344FC7D7
MGLFGGFKAKFSKDSVAKSNSKSSKNTEVVCLGYRVYSEFADPPHYSNQPPPEKRPLPVIKITSQKSDSNNVVSSSAAIHNSSHTNRNIEIAPNKQAPVAINHIPNRLRSNVSSISIPSSREDSISTRQNGIVTNPKAKQKNGISPKPAPRTATLSQSNVAETSIITNPKVKKPPKNKAAKDVSAPKKEIPFSQEDKTYISSTIPEIKKPERRTKSNSYVTEDPICVEGATTSINPAPNGRLAAEDEVRKTPPKSILKAKSMMEFQEAPKPKSSNTLSVPMSSETVTHSATSTIDENPINKDYSQNMRGIGNTSSFAANLFFAMDDDDDDEVTPGKNKNSAEC